MKKGDTIYYLEMDFWTTHIYSGTILECFEFSALIQAPNGRTTHQSYSNLFNNYWSAKSKRNYVPPNFHGT